MYRIIGKTFPSILLIERLIKLKTVTATTGENGLIGYLQNQFELKTMYKNLHFIFSVFHLKKSSLDSATFSRCLTTFFTLLTNTFWPLHF